MNKHTPSDERRLSAADLPSAVADAFPDAHAVSLLFAEHASFVVADGTTLTGRPAIAEYFNKLVEGADRWGTSLRGVRSVVSVNWQHPLSDDSVVLRTVGGMIMPGEDEVARERQGIQTWCVTRVDDDWLIMSYQNTRVL